MITRAQYDAASESKKQAEEVMHAYHAQESNKADERIKTGVPFADDELIYAALTLCPCGHGLAYPKNPGSLKRQWECSAVLRNLSGVGPEHSPALPFSCYEIKSEQQPSANGATTRGVFKPKPEAA